MVDGRARAVEAPTNNSVGHAAVAAPNEGLVAEACGFLKNDVAAPFVNSAVFQPYDTVAHTLNNATHAVGLGKLLPETGGLKVEAATPYSAGWFAQSISGGLGALVPYTIAGKAMGGAFRKLGASYGAEGFTAGLLRSEQAAYIAGAFTYDGLRPTQAGETHLGNAIGGAVGFGIFGAGNKLTAELPLSARLLGRVGTGFVGADAQLAASSFISNGTLPSADALMQAGVGGGAMNFALPVIQDGVNKAIVSAQVKTAGGAAADLYARAQFSQAVDRSAHLNNMLDQNPWARVRVGQAHPGYSRSENIVDLPGAKQTPAALGRELGHLREANWPQHESFFRVSSDLLQQGRVQDAWNVFHSTRAAQESSAHHSESVVNDELYARGRLDRSTLVQEMGAWPSPGGTSLEARWRQEFSQFVDSQGAWRPGDRVTTYEQFNPNAEKQSQAPARELTDAEKKLEYHRELANGLIEDLQRSGFIAVLAGGAVRDEAMGGKPKDFDIATSATPDEVQQLFESKGYHVIPKGKQFGVMSVVRDKTEFEIATLRNDGQYGDGRRPDGVQYVSSLYQDAARRDLTINAMFKDPLTGATYDFFGGRGDIANRTIRTVGDPNQRFAEDKLRMMRVPRFASRYDGFTVDPETVAAIKENAPKIGVVSAERIREELRGIFKGANPVGGLDIMMNTGLMRHVLPEVENLTSPAAMQDPTWHPEGLTWTHTRMVLDQAARMTPLNYPYRFERLFGITLHDIGKPATQKIDATTGRITNLMHAEVGAEMTNAIADRLKLSNAERDRIVSIVNLHMKMHALPELRTSKLMDMLTHPYIEDLKAMQHSDAVGTARPDAQSKSLLDWISGRQHDLSNAENAAQQLGAKPLVDGKVLIRMGIKPGERLGEIKVAALEAQREGAFSTLEEAQAWLQQNVPEFQK